MFISLGRYFFRRGVFFFRGYYLWLAGGIFRAFFGKGPWGIFSLGGGWGVFSFGTVFIRQGPYFNKTLPKGLVCLFYFKNYNRAFFSLRSGGGVGAFVFFPFFGPIQTINIFPLFTLMGIKIFFFQLGRGGGY